MGLWLVVSRDAGGGSGARDSARTGSGAGASLCKSFPRWRESRAPGRTGWIPACAGMTVGRGCAWGGRFGLASDAKGRSESLDSRLRGNDARGISALMVGLGEANYRRRRGVRAAIARRARVSDAGSGIVVVASRDEPEPAAVLP